jgi:hypothetical protein
VNPDRDSISDIGGSSANVRFTPKSGQSALQQLTELFDQLVGEGEQTRRDGETKCLCGRQVDS